MMSKKIGRNDACYCGSGKKFKKCCISERIIVADNDWQKIRETEGKLIDSILMPYVASVSKDLFSFAWEDFWQGYEDFPKDWYDGAARQLLSPWMVFDWKPCDLEELGDIEIEEGLKIALQFLQRNGHLLSDYEKEFIRKVCQTHYSFYCVTNVIPNENVTLKDIFLKSVVTVKELKGSRILCAGDIVFTRVLSIGNQAICVGMFPMMIPSMFHTELLDIRDELIKENGELNPKILADDLADDMRLILFHLFEEMLDRKSPVLTNTDGDSLVFCTSIFSLNCDAEEAYQALIPMTVSEDSKEPLANVKMDKKTGKIKRIEFPWMKESHKKSKNVSFTLLGDILIESNKLTLKVNSEKRAKNGEKEILKYLGNKVRFIKMKKSTVDQAMKRQNKSDSRPKREFLPEEKTILENHYREYYAKWLNESLPILNGLTPREAILTENGRERLMAILLDFERRSNNLWESEPKPDIEWLKKELGLN